MRTFNLPGDYGNIYQCIENGLIFAHEHPDWKICCEFNGVEFFVTTDSTFDSCYEDYMAGIKEQEKKYLQSDEYKMFLRAQDKKREKMNSEAQIIMSKFENLVLPANTFDEMKAVLDWLCEYQPYSDCDICDVADDEIVLKRLNDVGYKVDAHVGNSEITKDMKMYFEYLIGQAMSTMEFLALHGSILTGRDMWVNRFDVRNKV